MRINVELYKPMPYQVAVHRGLAEHWEGATHVVKAVRQCGKSYMCVNILLKASLEHPNQISIFIAPTLAQSRLVYNSIIKACRGCKLVVGANSILLSISFINGSEIKFLSAEQGDSIRGNTVTKHGILIIDEAAYIKDDIYYESSNFVNANKAPTLCVSTPRFKNGFFYTTYNDGLEGNNNVYSYDFTEFHNPFLTEERLKMFQSRMPINLFKADYLGQWMEATSDLFGDYEKVLSNTATMDGQYTAGIDWGVGKNAGGNSDSTALAIFNSSREMVKLYHWNDLDETQTIDKIVTILSDLRVQKAVCETNSIGSVYLGLLRRKIAQLNVPTSIVEFNTTNDTKRQIIENFIVHVQNRTVQLLDDPILKIQMSAYEMKKTTTGKITYGNSSDQYHDDTIIATALALHGLNQAIYSVI